jgi:hypothetical protein
MVGNYNGVIRFQGAVAGGTSAKIGTLPSNFPKPPVTVFLTTGGYSPAPARIYIDTAGNIGFDTLPVEIGSRFLSLEGVSFGT